MNLEHFQTLYQVMDPSGKLDKSKGISVSSEEIEKMYKLMVFTRLWNTKALSLQRQGRMGTLASVRGQEASNVGMGLALGPNDWFCPSFREFGAMFTRGITPKDLYSYWGGDERGGMSPEANHVLPVCITVGSHLCHAVGIAWAAKIKGDKIAVLSSSGDGSTSQGDFHESLNFAGVFKLPVVFVIQNNQWAISIPVERQTASRTIAQKAVAYDMEGFRVDGNDVLAVYHAVKKCMDKAREEREPALIELVTYRMDDHTTADDASRYRTEEMVAPWRDKDPIDRVRRYMTENCGWRDEKEASVLSELNAEVEQAVRDYEAVPTPSPEEIFNHMYAEPPWNLLEQKSELLRTIGRLEG